MQPDHAAIEPFWSKFEAALGGSLRHWRDVHWAYFATKVKLAYQLRAFCIGALGLAAGLAQAQEAASAAASATAARKEPYCPNQREVTQNLEFPAEARAAGIDHARFAIRFEISPSGDIENITPLGDAHPAFIEAAVRGVRQLKCEGLGRRMVAQMPFTFDPPPPLYKLKPDFSFLGMTFSGGNNATGSIPFDLPYESLSRDQQARFKAAYEPMADGDEPPYPIGGLAAIYDPITKVQQRLLVKGDFVAEVMVNPQGEAVSIAVLKTPGEKATKFLAAVLLLTKYKPARCGRVACAMAFPVRIGLSVN